MKRNLTVEDLARDGRFFRVTMEDRMNDPRNLGGPGAYGRDAADQADDDARAARGLGRMTPDAPNAPDAARSLMHGIFVGEIQALEGAGRTCYDFDLGDGPDDVPYGLKLDMARQCRDEARHCEISVKLTEWMGTEIGEFTESPFLFQAACSPDALLRLAGVNRALEGLAIDVFNTMRNFGDKAGDPVLEFCEDWMLADEVTHVKMGSDWIRKLTVNDPERRAKVLEFQAIVDKLFSLGGGRADEDDSPIKLARQFRKMAGFTDEEIDTIAGLSKEARDEADTRIAARRAMAPADSAAS